MTDVAKGGNLALAPETWSGLRIAVSWASAPGLDLDVAAVAVGADGRCAGPDHVLSHDRPRAVAGALRLDSDGRGATGADQESMTAELSRLPEDVAKVLVVLSIHEAALRGHTFAQLEAARVDLTTAAGAAVASFEL